VKLGEIREETTEKPNMKFRKKKSRVADNQNRKRSTGVGGWCKNDNSGEKITCEGQGFKGPGTRRENQACSSGGRGAEKKTARRKKVPSAPVSGIGSISRGKREGGTVQASFVKENNGRGPKPVENPLQASLLSRIRLTGSVKRGKGGKLHKKKKKTEQNGQAFSEKSNFMRTCTGTIT